MQARIDASAELRALYERERQVVEILHRVRTTDRAPASLRGRIEAQRPSAASRARRRLVYGCSLAVALAVVVVALVLIVPAGMPAAPSVSQAAALAVRGPIAAAPHSNSSDRDVLDRRVEHLSFPNWLQDLGWRAVGQRADLIAGRAAVTVYYERQQRTLAYTIVGSPALKAPAATTTRLHGSELRTLTLGGRLVVTWRRDDHTCVLSGTGVERSVLHQLAAYNPSAARTTTDPDPRRLPQKTKGQACSE